MVRLCIWQVVGGVDDDRLKARASVQHSYSHQTHIHCLCVLRSAIAPSLTSDLRSALSPGFQHIEALLLPKQPLLFDEIVPIVFVPCWPVFNTESSETS